MKRAAQLFALEEESSESPFVERTWRTRSEPEASFISVAVSHWTMVVTRQSRLQRLTIRRPETKATIVPIPEDAEFFIIWFSHGTYMPRLPLVGLTDRSVDLPTMSSSKFLLDGSAWEFPGPDDADAFVAKLVRRGLLVRDPIAVAALQGDVTGLSRRSVERRVSRATGLTQGAIRQIERAEQAVELLERGLPVAETVSQTGYADQAHLTRSLKRFIGQTPSQIAGSCRFRSRRRARPPVDNRHAQARELDVHHAGRSHRRPSTVAVAGLVRRPWGHHRDPLSDRINTMPKYVVSSTLTDPSGTTPR